MKKVRAGNVNMEFICIMENSPKKRRKRDMIRKGCIKLYEICEELNVSCKRVTWDTDASGTWMEHYKGVDDWILRKEEKGHRKTA